MWLFRRKPKGRHMTDDNTPTCSCGRPLEPYGNGWLICAVCDRPTTTKE